MELSVSDLKDDAVFVAFDMEIVMLTSIQASKHLKLRRFWEMDRNLMMMCLWRNHKWCGSRRW
ncbi:unnamed protein product [Brassica rapa]|uniref:Uncharacterized protein n=1 Tax=Brassica campestris TaxID=3711 RepID=A0A8D9H890_BRACM|nr:unnamed protein product [Brassica rapa]